MPGTDLGFSESRLESERLIDILSKNLKVKPRTYRRIDYLRSAPLLSIFM